MPRPPKGGRGVSPPVSPVKDITVDREEVRKDLSAEKDVRGDNDVRWVEGEEDGWPPRPPRLRG